MSWKPTIDRLRVDVKYLTGLLKYSGGKSARIHARSIQALLGSASETLAELEAAFPEDAAAGEEVADEPMHPGTLSVGDFPKDASPELMAFAERMIAARKEATEQMQKLRDENAAMMRELNKLVPGMKLPEPDPTTGETP